MHHLAKAVRDMSKHLRKASILGQRGWVETDTAVEARVDRKERVSAEQRRRQQAHKELVARVLPREADRDAKEGFPDADRE